MCIYIHIYVCFTYMFMYMIIYDYIDLIWSLYNHPKTNDANAEETWNAGCWVQDSYGVQWCTMPSCTSIKPLSMSESIFRLDISPSFKIIGLQVAIKWSKYCGAFKVLPERKINPFHSVVSNCCLLVWNVMCNHSHLLHVWTYLPTFWWSLRQM